MQSCFPCLAFGDWPKHMLFSGGGGRTAANQTGSCCRQSSLEEKLQPFRQQDLGGKGQSGAVL